jgi:hypothetical protein
MIHFPIIPTVTVGYYTSVLFFGAKEKREIAQEF